MRYFTACLLSTVALGLAGCSSLENLAQTNDPDIENVVGEVWKVQTLAPRGCAP